MGLRCDIAENDATAFIFSPAFFSFSFLFSHVNVPHLFCYLISVMDAWGKWTQTNDKIIMAADGNGEFVNATGLVQGMSQSVLTRHKMMACGKSRLNSILLTHHHIAVLSNPLDLTKIGFGPTRSLRFALVADDLKVTYLGIETASGVSVSGADAVLAAL